MHVEVTNITDGPGKSPEEVVIFTRTLAPGEAIKIPAELVTEKLRTLEARGKISIGQAPSWYVASKLRRGKELSLEEVQKRIAARSKPVATPKLHLTLVDEVKVGDELTTKVSKKKG